MKKVILLNKKEGETPLECLENFRSKNKEYRNIPMTYAGRLDPMAEGLLLVLAGDECKNKEKYLNLDKEYEFRILFGFATDTYDILGKVTHSKMRAEIRIKSLEIKIKKELKKIKGKSIQEYPIYSSKTVLGKPLFMYGRAGEDVEIPKREVMVRELKFIKIQKINSKKLLENIKRRVSKVKGDFRQKEILKIWQKELRNDNSYFVANFKTKCSSGTYVRSIANSLGSKLSVPALAFSIKRTKIGKWSRI